MWPPRWTLNGETATLEAIASLAGNNYGHFTALQARAGLIQAWPLHLARLQAATRELFGKELAAEPLRAWLHDALRGQDAAVRISVFSRAFDRDRPSRAATPDLLIALHPPRVRSTGPLRVCSVVHQREAPHIKHLGSFGLFNQRRLAQQRGFDDALFLGVDGCVSEGTTWNLGFHDGERIVWPAAPMLDGISMQLLKEGLARLGVPQMTRPLRLSDLRGMRSAFFTNSACACMPLACIDDLVFEADAETVDLLRAALATTPWQDP